MVPLSTSATRVSAPAALITRMLDPDPAMWDLARPAAPRAPEVRGPVRAKSAVPSRWGGARPGVSGSHAQFRILRAAPTAPRALSGEGIVWFVRRRGSEARAADPPVGGRPE